MTASTMSPTAAPARSELILSQLVAIAAWRVFPDAPALWTSRKSIASRSPSEAIVALQNLFETTVHPRVRGGLNRPAFWKHAIAVACAARTLVESITSDISGEMAFGAGLLHDIGKIALDSALPKSYARVLRRSMQTHGHISDVERDVLGIDHATAGRYLAQRWGVPRPMVDCIWLHHHDPSALPASIAQRKLVQFIQLADALARMQRIGHSGNFGAVPSIDELSATLGISQDSVHAVAASLAPLVEDCLGQIQETARTSIRWRGRKDVSFEGQLPSKHTEFVSALASFHQSTQSGCGLGELCERAAEAVRDALRVDATLVAVGDSSRRWHHVGIAGHEKSHHEVIERAAPSSQEADEDVAVQTTAAGCWIAKPPQSFDDLTNRYSSELGHDECWLLPLVAHHHWIGGVFFATPATHIANLLRDREVLASLSTELATTILHAQTLHASQALADELAEANRRLAATQGDMLRARNLETMAALAAGAAHELNNPLAVISGRAQMLGAQAANSDLRTQLDTIASQAQAASNVVSELMEFAEPRHPDPQQTSVRGIVESVAAELISARLLAEDQLIIELSSDTPFVWFDADFLGRTIRELMTNAIEATRPEGRCLTVKAWPDPTEDFLVVRVIDNGRGMTPETLGRAMDAFYSSRPAGRGRGLGLARVARWIADGGAAIRMESSPGAGTCVELRLPTRPSRGP